MLPGIIPNYRGEFINIFSFSCMGYRGQPDKIERVIKMRAFPAPYTIKTYSNFGKRGSSTFLFKQWVRYLEQTFKV